MSKKYGKANYFVNRELSWLDFNGRVLEEARDPENPLLERANFLGITQSNVDEFFMVRIASLYKLHSAGVTSTDISGMTPKEQIDAVNEKEQEMVAKRYTTYNRSLLPQLEKNNINILQPENLNTQQYEFIRRYFNDELYPVLTPMADDSSRPFPFISNESLNIAVRLQKNKDKEHVFATVRVPDVFARLVKLPTTPNDFILLEDIIKEFISQLFTGYEVKNSATYRVIRDMDLDVAEEDTSDLLRAVQKQLKEREHGGAVRLEIESTMHKSLRNRLLNNFNINEKATYTINGPIDLTFLKKLPKLVINHDDLKYPTFKSYANPLLSSNHDIFQAIREHDYLLQHPYDSFSSVINFIRQAANDSNVLAIKMTLYRVSGNSPIIKYLGLAAQRGKQVTVLVEVKARFDEENNVRWAKKLEQMGCHVIYGLVGLKTHSKIALIIRRDEDGIRRYLHLGTGNYNDITANFYTDMGLLTCDRDMGIDATNLFNMLSGYSQPPYFHKLHLSPQHIRNFINEKIGAEILAAKQGRPAEIRMKMNSLSDGKIIEKLYEASAAGVKVKLIIRGICCLRNNIPNISTNIEVHSIVGRFLEHSRIYYFYNDGNEDVYLSSADMMSRNLNRRVEILFPILQNDIRLRTIDIFNTMWQDNTKTRVLNGTQFKKLNRRGLQSLNAQEYFIEEAKKMNKKLLAKNEDNTKRSTTFQPMTKRPNDLLSMKEEDN